MAMEETKSDHKFKWFKTSLPVKLKQQTSEGNIHKIWIYQGFERVENSVCTMCGMAIMRRLDFTDSDTVKIETDREAGSGPYKIENDIITFITPKGKIDPQSFRITKLTEKELEVIIMMDYKKGKTHIKGDMVKLIFEAEEN